MHDTLSRWSYVQGLHAGRTGTPATLSGAEIAAMVQAIYPRSHGLMLAYHIWRCAPSMTEQYAIGHVTGVLEAAGIEVHTVRGSTAPTMRSPKGA